MKCATITRMMPIEANFTTKENVSSQSTYFVRCIFNYELSLVSFERNIHFVFNFQDLHVLNSLTSKWKANKFLEMVGPHGLHFLVHFFSPLFTSRGCESFLHKFRICIILHSNHESIPFNFKSMIMNVSTQLRFRQSSI